MSDFSLIEKELTEKAQKVKEVNILFLDLSSNCVGWSVAGVDFEARSARFKDVGAFWLNPDWDAQEKYHYIYTAIVDFFNICHKIDGCVVESYRINVNKLMGAQVSIEIHGVVALALKEIGVKYNKIEVSTWRKQLGVKPDITFDAKGKKVRDYKLPTKKVVEKYVQLPEKICNNITGVMRGCPSDLVDSIAQGLAFLQLINIRHFNFKEVKIQAHNGQVVI